MRRLEKSFSIAIKNLRANKARTALSLSGIVIGVGAIMLVLSLGLGVKAFVFDQVQSFGTDIVEVEIKVPQTEHMSSENAEGVATGNVVTSFKLKDAEELGETPNVLDWYGGSLGQAVASYQEKNKTVNLFGTTAGFARVDASFELESGRFFVDEEDRSLFPGVILGSSLKESLFLASNPLGETIKLGGKRYKVIGVAKERGGSGFFDWDEMAYLPIRTLQKRILGVDYISFAMYKIENMENVDYTMEEMRFKMRELHEIDNPKDDDFAVVSIAEAIELLEDVFAVVNILLVGLTSISLLVGGVGIMNVMYVSVSERTFEIGLRKAVGAKKGDILSQFIIEAMALTLIGGFFGVILGWVLAKIAQLIILKFGLELTLPFSLLGVFLGVGFAFLTGLFFGIAPAKKASQLSPMEAIRKD